MVWRGGGVIKGETKDIKYNNLNSAINFMMIKTFWAMILETLYSIKYLLLQICSPLN
jgi:hypothetical protein